MFTIPRPIDQRTLKRSKDRFVKGSSPGSVEELPFIAHSAGFVVQTMNRRSTGGRGLLNDFLTLETGSDRRILSFARKWGPLYLCQHHRPFGHNAPGRPGYDSETRCEPIGFGREGWPWELLEDWRRYSHEAATILKLIELAYRRKDQPQTQCLYEAHSRVNHWLLEGDAVLAVEFGPETQDQLTVSVSECAGVFGLIGLQLMSTLTRSTRPISCSACGAVFFPKRPAPTGIRRYCAACRRSGAPTRDASRDWYRNHKRKARK
jgi:hypothetical protein